MPGRKRRRGSQDAAAAADDPGTGGAAAAAEPPEPEPQCWCCLEETRGRVTRSGALKLVHCGCACRGGAGWVHGPCLVQAAQHNTMTWAICPTCKQNFGGPIQLSLVEERWRLAQELPSTGEYGVEEERSSAMQTLAAVYIHRARYAEARELIERVVERDEAEYGAQHVVTLGSKLSLAQALLDMGRFAPGKALAEEVVAMVVVVAAEAESNPNETTQWLVTLVDGTLDAKAVLAQALRYSGEDDDAHNMWQEIVSARVTIGGQSSHDTIIAKHMFADSLFICGGASQARELYAEALTG